MRWMSLHIAHAYLWVAFATESQIIGHRETIAVFCLYSIHGRFCINNYVVLSGMRRLLLQKGFLTHAICSVSFI